MRGSHEPATEGERPRVPVAGRDAELLGWPMW